MSFAQAKIWGKAELVGDRIEWHPLVLHMLDVAAVADEILLREPESTRDRLAKSLGLSWVEARPWILLAIACHDLGKASPGFQLKRPEVRESLLLAGLDAPNVVDPKFAHGVATHLLFAELLLNEGWEEELADLVASAVGCHHGERSSAVALTKISGNRRSLGSKEGWNALREDLFRELKRVFQTKASPVSSALTGPEFVFLAGLTSFADWIGSNTDWFPYGSMGDADDLQMWYERSRERARVALDGIRWFHRRPLADAAYSFRQVFSEFEPRPLQVTVEEEISGLQSPGVLLIEAPMGEGKTEAALYAFLELQRRFEHRGLFVGMPTRATGNAMFERVLSFLLKRDVRRSLDCQLVHGSATLNEMFVHLKIRGIHDPDGGGEVRAGEWFTNKKRALLSEYGVGSVDQALMTILPVRHHFVRLWGLANRVVVFDEIHAYDTYTGTLLIELIRWLRALGSSVVLLSATVPRTFRQRLAGVCGLDLSESEPVYPRLSFFGVHQVTQRTFSTDSRRRRCLRLERLGIDLNEVRDLLLAQTGDGVFAAAIVNTVSRAQDLYRSFPAGKRIHDGESIVGKRLDDGLEIYLLHARFPADQRSAREREMLRLFGKEGLREGRKILIATQVAEQSLDLDFDVMITDLAPVDLVLQRAGRLWRHERTNRKTPEARLFVAGLRDESPPSFKAPLWWDSVYRADLLLKTWIRLRPLAPIHLPDDIDRLVQSVYDDPPEEVSHEIIDRYTCAEEEGEGQTYAYRLAALREFIGYPDDGSWNDPARFLKADEDDPSIHSSLIARTRLGEKSVTVILLRAEEGDLLKTEPRMSEQVALSQRTLSVSRKDVVDHLLTAGLPEAWKRASLLRNFYPMVFDESGRWTFDSSVVWSYELGLVYERHEQGRGDEDE